MAGDKGNASEAQGRSGGSLYLRMVVTLIDIKTQPRNFWL